MAPHLIADAKVRTFLKKTNFSDKNLRNLWAFQKFALPLHSQNGK
jgi:hypothetical protein